MTTIAHRGYSSITPENTMSAIKKALSSKHVDMIEIDVHLTKDNEVVVFHDFEIDNKSDGKGLIKDMTYKELLKYDVGSWFSEEFENERMCNLKEVMLATKNKKKLIIEVKMRGGYYKGIEEKIAELIKELSMHDEVCVKSFDHRVVKKIKEIDKNIETGILIYGAFTDLKYQIKASKADFVSLCGEFLDKEVMEEVESAGAYIMTWTIDESEHIKMVKSLSNKIMIITNYPERV